MTEHEKANKKLWDELTPVHFKSYNVSHIKEGGTNIDGIQRQEVGPVQGKSLLHLQCHFGLDSLCWTREGARVTGVDFSEQSIAYANALKQELNLQTRFICSNIYDLPQTLDETFDIVYTSKGVLPWLKDLKTWAMIVEQFLKPGGFFYIMEEHPIVYIFDDTAPGSLVITYPYFHQSNPQRWDGGSEDYADPDYIVKNPSYEWQWSISDIINSILGAGLELEFFREYHKGFYKSLPDMRLGEDGWYYLPDHQDKLPLLFTLRARKPKKNEE